MRKETDLKMRVYIIWALISVATAAIAPNVQEILKAQESLPSVEANAVQAYTSSTNDAEAQPIEETNTPINIVELGSDGYQYKTVRRLKYRERRDVNQLAHEYLPPPAETNIASKYISPAEEASYQLSEELVVPQDTVLLRATDGQSAADVAQDNAPSRVTAGNSHAEVNAAPEYIPPDVPQDNALPRIAAGNSHAEVNAAPEYIPPDVSHNFAILGAGEDQQPTEINTALGYIPPDVPQNNALLRVVDDQSHAEVNAAPEYIPPNGPHNSAVLRAQYIPPVEEAVPQNDDVIALRSTEQLNEPQDTAVLGEDGYQYKVVRRLKYRQRRDVAPLASSEYLPPNEVNENDSTVIEVPEKSAVLAEDGYHYRTIKRLRF